MLSSCSWVCLGIGDLRFDLIMGLGKVNNLTTGQLLKRALVHAPPPTRCSPVAN